MVYGYIRVSTETQTVENQKIVIEKWTQARGLVIDEWIAETISGTKALQKRKLGSLVSKVQPQDTIIITELSRLGRSMIMILNILQTLLENNIKVYAIKENYELGDNIQSKVLAFAFGLSAEIERQLISERTKAGLERARIQGKRIGRQKGVSPKKYKLTGKEDYIKQELSRGRSKNSLSKELGVTWITLARFIKRP